MLESVIGVNFVTVIVVVWKDNLCVMMVKPLCFDPLSGDIGGFEREVVQKHLLRAGGLED